MIPYVVGLNHEHAGVEVREKLAFSDSKKTSVGREIRAAIGEVVVVCTCNRTEIFGLAVDAGGVNRAGQLLGQAADFSDEMRANMFYTHTGDAALEHVYRVAAGLESMVIGEPQILGQIKDAFTHAEEVKISADVMGKIQQHLLETVKRARHESRVGFGQVSISTLAVQLARDIFECLADKTITLVGAGEMAELAAQHFAAAGGRIVVVNRSEERGQALAGRFNGSYRPWESLGASLSQADVVVCSTASEEPILTRELVAGAMRRRKTPLFVIDIAIPRDVAADVSDLREVYVYNLDDLQKLIAENQQRRQECAAIASRIIREALAKGSPLASDIVGPVISSLRSRVSSVSDGELARLFQKHPDWNEREREAVRQAVTRITNKVLHDPIIALRSDSSGESHQRSTLLVNFKRFFNLDDG